MKKIVFLFTLILMLAGCGKADPVQTVDWYKTHDAERKAINEKCKNNPGELSKTPNCQNAGEAQDRLMWSSRNID